MNFELEIAKLLLDNAELQRDYPRICAVAQVVARNEDDYMPYVWAYATGKRNWKELEKKLF
jgi:hypothetical protein